MENNNHKDITLNDLARMMQNQFTDLRSDMNQRFEQVDKRFDQTATKEDLLNAQRQLSQELQLVKGELRRDIRSILAEDEKDELFIMVEHYNEGLKKATLGEDRITLTREEYDEVQKLAGFPHRFQTE